MEDFRQAPRIEVQCPCTFSGEHVVGDGIVVNFSRPGCAVESNMRVPIGTYLELHILVPVHFFPMAVDQAVVVWSSEDKFGVKFIRLRAVEQARLYRFITQYLKHDNGANASDSTKLPKVWPSHQLPGATRPWQSSLTLHGGD